MEADPDKSGIFWFSFGGTRNSLAEVQALIRPVNWESVSESCLQISIPRYVVDATSYWFVMTVFIPESHPVSNIVEALEALDRYNVRDFNVRYECVFTFYRCHSFWSSNSIVSSDMSV